MAPKPTSGKKALVMGPGSGYGFSLSTPVAGTGWAAGHASRDVMSGETPGAERLEPTSLSARLGLAEDCCWRRGGGALSNVHSRP